MFLLIVKCFIVEEDFKIGKCKKWCSLWLIGVSK